MFSSCYDKNAGLGLYIHGHSTTVSVMMKVDFNPENVTSPGPIFSGSWNTRLHLSRNLAGHGRWKREVWARV